MIYSIVLLQRSQHQRTLCRCQQRTTRRVLRFALNSPELISTPIIAFLNEGRCVFKTALFFFSHCLIYTHLFLTTTSARPQHTPPSISMPRFKIIVCTFHIHSINHIVFFMKMMFHRF